MLRSITTFAVNSVCRRPGRSIRPPAKISLHLSVARLHRLETEKLDDEDVVEAL